MKTNGKAKEIGETPASQSSVLVVDDNEMNRDMLSRRLQRKGYEVAVAHDGDLALELIRDHRFDLVLLDVTMPGVNGLEVLRILREAHTATDLPIIMATAHRESEDIVKALALGANDYVTKPLDFPVVLARVQTHLALKRAAEQVRQLERTLVERNRELEADQRATGEGQRPDVTRPEGGGQDSGDLPAPRGTPRSGPGLRLDLPALRRTGRRRAEHRAARRRADRALHPGRQRPRRRVGPAVGDAEPSSCHAPPEPSSILVRDGNVPDRPEITPPAEVADHLNRLFPFDPATGQFTTMIYGILDAVTGEFRYVSAGHPGPVHLPAGTGPVMLESDGSPIGLAKDAYEERSVRLAAGDRLYLYSDGVPEAMDPVGEQFGYARLLQAIGRGGSEPLQENVAALLGEIERWRGAASAQDDIAILAVEVSAVAGRGEPGGGNQTGGSL